MRVLLLNYEYPPMGGGAGNATRSIARELSREGHEATVLTSRFGDQERQEIVDGVEVHRVFSWRKGIHDCGLRGAYSFLAAAYPRLVSICRRTRFDVCHYFFTVPTAALTFAPGPHNAVPFIVSLRGSDVPYYDEYNTTIHRMNMLLKPVIRNIWRRAGGVVALSEGLKKTARRTDPEVEISVIPNGIDADLFNIAPGAARSDDGVLRLITVSRLIRRKGIDYLLEAAAAIRHELPLRLKIVGVGSHAAQLRQLSKKLHLDDIVDFVGYRPRETLPVLYNESDLFVLPSLAESFGLVFAEAMACGLPVIGSLTGGVTDLVREENGILVTPGSVKEIREALLRLGNDAEHRCSMSSANRAKMVREYSWSSIAAQYVKIYRGIARGMSSSDAVR